VRVRNGGAIPTGQSLWQTPEKKLFRVPFLGSVNLSPLGDGMHPAMQTGKSGSHTFWDCKYHLVWVTKYRYSVLVGDVGLRARELLREIARSHEMMITAVFLQRGSQLRSDPVAHTRPMLQGAAATTSARS
jgi:hypothetical protein